MTARKSLQYIDLAYVWNVEKLALCVILIQNVKNCPVLHHPVDCKQNNKLERDGTARLIIVRK